NSVGLIFESRGKINNSAARVARRLPVLASGRRVGGKESEIYILKLFCAHVLDERGLPANGFQLPERLVVIQQLHISCGEIAIIEHFRNFFAFKRPRADNGEAIET